MSLSDISIKNPVFAWMLMLGLMFFGLFSYGRMGVSQLPDIDSPVVSVSVSWEGAAPEVIEKDVVDELEQALMTVQGVKQITSTSRQGQGSVKVELELEQDIDVAVQEIQSKINEVQRRLPNDIDPPVIRKQNPSEQPIMSVAVSGDCTKQELMKYVEKHVRDRFTTISGVGEVILGGFVDPNLRVWVDNEKLNAYELTVEDVMAAITREHSELPAGRLETPRSEQSVRVMGEAISPEDFGDILITQRAGKPVYRPIRLKDVATIEDGLDDVRQITRFKGRTGVGLLIKKQAGANEVAVAHEVKKRIEEVKKDLPDFLDMRLGFDRTKFIEESIHELTFTLVLSAIVTSLVCWFFLGAWSATLNILLAIPTSILGCFIVIYFLGFTLNTFTVLALSLAVGIVVDDAIMVLENIVRFREGGDNKEQASRRGANQIMGAATAATLALIAIFIPVAFVSGMIGKLFYEFGVTISVAVAISLLEALMLTPMRCSQFLQVGHTTAFGRRVDEGFRALARGYGWALQGALRFRWIVVIVSVLVFVASLFLVRILKKEFVPPQDQSLFMCTFQASPDSSITFMDERMKEAEKFVASRPEVSESFVSIGGFGGGEVNRATMFVVLKDPRSRPVDPVKGKRLSQGDIMQVFRKELNKIADLEVKIRDLSLSSFSARRGAPVEYSLRGPDWDQLIQYSTLMLKKMKESGLMVDEDTDYQAGAKELRVVPDRQKAEAYGVSMESVGRSVGALVGGVRAGKYSSGDRRYDVRVRLVADQRKVPADIGKIWVVNNRGERVLLKDVVTFHEQSTALTITREDRERAISVSANVAPGKDQTAAMAEAERIAKEILPEGYHAVLSGNAKSFQESSQGIALVFWLGILVAYMVIGSQYNSFLQPFIVLLALPFSISGAFVALLMSGQSINMYSMIGVILLMGIVKKNSILLVDFTNQVRGTGKKVEESLLTACPIRLRPILMTSCSTIAAAIPPALAMGPGAEVRIPMAITVIGGVLVSTVFTLFVVPCVYRITVRDSWAVKSAEV